MQSRELTLIVLDAPFPVVICQEYRLLLLFPCCYDCDFVALRLSADQRTKKVGTAAKRCTKSAFYSFTLEKEVAEQLGAEVQSGKLYPRTQQPSRGERGLHQIFEVFCRFRNRPFLLENTKCNNAA